MSIFEDPFATWTKRFMQTHYSYRDYHTATTQSQPLTAAAIIAQTYTFGDNARIVNALGGGGIYNWPRLDDWDGALGTYARSVMILATTDTMIAFTCVNPRYIILLGQGYTVAEIAGQGVPATITDDPTFIPTNTLVTFSPTYGAAITFYYVTVEGTIRIWVEGNQEGTD